MNTTEDRRIYTSCHSAISDPSENFRAEHAVEVIADFKEECEDINWIADTGRVFLKSFSSSLSPAECLFRMMICDNLGDEGVIAKILKLPPDCSRGGNINSLKEWLAKGTRYGKAELLYEIRNHDVEHPPTREKNRKAEAELVPFIEQALKKGKFAYFLLARGTNKKEFMLIHAAGTPPGTITYRALPSAVCETKAPFEQALSARGLMEDRFEDWWLFGLNRPQQSVPVSTGS